MKKHSIIAGSSLLGSLFVAAPGHGQQAESEPLDANVPSNELVPWELLNPAADEAPAFRIWEFDAQLRATASIRYSDNVNSAGDASAKRDWEASVSPSISLVKSDERKDISFGYTPYFRLFVRNPEYTTVDHRLYLRGRLNLSKARLNAGLSFSKSGDGLAEIGDREDVYSYGANAGISYPLGVKTSLSVGGSVSASDADGVISNIRYNNSNSVNYQATQKTSVGVGFGFGYTDVDTGVDQTSQSVSALASYQSTAKTVINASVGGQFRQYDGGREDTFTPTFSVGGAYLPREGTSISLGASHSTSPSLTAQSQNYDNLSFNLGVNQRIRERLSANAGIGYSIREYQSNLSGVSVGREDTYYTFNAGIAYQMAQHFAFSFRYGYRRNDSDVTDFESNRFSFSVTWTY